MNLTAVDTGQIGTLRNCSSSDPQTKHFVSYIFPHPSFRGRRLDSFLLLPDLSVGFCMMLFSYPDFSTDLLV